MIRFIALAAFILTAACGKMTESSRTRPGDGAVIYPATIITMEAAHPSSDAVAVKDGKVLAVGDLNDLVEGYPGADVDETFARMTILPGFIDPHVHMALSSIMYATTPVAPWPVEGALGPSIACPDRISLLARLADIETAAPEGEPVIVWGYQDLAQGPIARADLDAITTTRPLIVWHYSGHDFFLNSKALEWTKITGALHEKFTGVEIDDEGEPTGRIFEDALPYLLRTLAPYILSPDRVQKGLSDFSTLLNRGGVTTVSDLAYGVFGFDFENANIAGNWVSPEHSGYKLYLVPEARAFSAAFGEAAPQTIIDMAEGTKDAPAPVLRQAKFFTDGAFYSETMRLSAPYLSGQSEGTRGVWVTPPQSLAAAIKPYWDAGLQIRIHSNGDAAQTATLAALEALRASDKGRRFVIEHGGLFSAAAIEAAGALGADVSAASHYVFYLGEAYQAALGPERGQWITPLASLARKGVHVSLHSDAPLAPPFPLEAASRHLTRATREGGVLTPEEALSADTALKAITIDAARALGLEAEIGSIAPGKKADFTILKENPLATSGDDWPAIPVWGVVLDGEKRPLR